MSAIVKAFPNITVVITNIKIKSVKAKLPAHKLPKENHRFFEIISFALSIFDQITLKMLDSSFN
jgi:hypothetical protein